MYVASIRLISVRLLVARHESVQKRLPKEMHFCLSPKQQQLVGGSRCRWQTVPGLNCHHWKSLVADGRASRRRHLQRHRVGRAQTTTCRGVGSLLETISKVGWCCVVRQHTTGTWCAREHATSEVLKAVGLCALTSWLNIRAERRRSVLTATDSEDFRKCRLGLKYTVVNFADHESMDQGQQSLSARMVFVTWVLMLTSASL